MTDERLEQILTQALAPEIDDYEIQRKVRSNNMNMKKLIRGGLVACATLALIATAVFANVRQNENNENCFVITAHAAELPEGVTSGDVVTLSVFSGGYGSQEYLDGRFAVSGQNIERVKISTDKCNIYTVNTFSEEDNDYEHLTIVGNTYEGAYDDNMSFGMSVPEELWSNKEDAKAAYHEDVDQVSGATLTIEVTFYDGSTEVHHYRLNTGNIYVPADENGYLQWDNLTRFLADDENTSNTPYAYGYLMEKID